jgi:hypothetical protein
MEVSDQLANLGAIIAGGIERNVQQTQFNNALPAMQQAFQSAMTDFDKGNSGAGFLKIMGVAMENPNNPYIQNVSQMAFQAGKEASDSYSYRMKATQAPSLAEIYLAKQLGLGLPTTPSENPPPSSEVTQTQDDTGGVGAGAVDSDTVTLTPAQSMLAELDGELPTGGFESEVANVFDSTDQISKTKGVGAGLASQNFVVDFDPNQFKSEKLPTGSSQYLGAGVDTILVPNDPNKLRQSGATLKGSVANITFENVDTDPTKMADRRLEFKQELSNAVSALDNSKEVQELIKHFGSFKNIGPFSETKDGIEWRIPTQDGKFKKISLKTGTENKPKTGDYFQKIIAAPNVANIIGTPLYMSGESEVPAVGGGKIGQTSVNPKVANAMVQAQKELPNASKDQIIARAKEIAKGL